MSTENIRKKKPVAKQKAPIRNRGIFSASRAADPASKDQGETDNDIENLVYSIMEDQLKAGTFGAQSIGSGGRGFGPAGQPGSSDPVSAFLSQWMTLYTQMLNMSMAMFENFADMREKHSDPIPFPSNRPSEAEATEQSAHKLATVPSPVKINLICRKPAEVIVDLRVPASLDCRVQPLQSLDGNRGTIKNIKFETIDGVVTIVLTVPKNCASGTYVGAVISEHNNTGCGTITVKL